MIYSAKQKKGNKTFCMLNLFKQIELKYKEEHLHCHELEQRYISEIIELGNYISDRPSNNNTSNGLDNEAIENYPICIIKNINVLSESKKKCLICLDEFKNGQKSIVLPCIHIFHSECIKKWMKTENFCPLCKNQII